MSDVATDPNAVVSHEQDGRVLSGVGVSADRLAETMDRHAPDPAETPADALHPVPVPVPAGATAEPLTAPKLTRGQARFSELTEQRKAAERERDELKRERDELKARFAQQPAVQQPQTAPEPQAPPPQTFTRQKPTEDEVGAKYPTYGAYAEDLAQWVIDQRDSQLDQRIGQRIEANAAQQAFVSSIERSWVRGRTAYPDFDAVRTNGPGANVAMPALAVKAIYDLPNTEHVQYAIMRDGALAQKLANIAIRAAGGDLGASYEWGVTLASVAPAGPAASPASTGHPGSVMPPAPIQPVGSGSKTTTPSSAELVKGFDFDASGYRERRAAERGGRR